MELIGRSREIERIRDRVAAPGPSLSLLSGSPRSGKTALLRAALSEHEPLWYQAEPLTDPDHRGLLARRMRAFLEPEDARVREAPREGGDDGGRLTGGADWPELLQALAEHLYATHRSTVVVLDGWHRLVEARSRLPRHLTEFWLEVRRRGIPLHLLLASAPGPAVAPFRDPEDPLGRWLDEDLRLGPLAYREVTDVLYGRGAARDRLTMYGVFGGWPDVVRHLEPEHSLETNVLRHVLGSRAPLLDWGTERLVREIQAPARYTSVLRALGEGAREWGEIREAAPDFGSSGQMAPYIQRLEEMGVVSVARSLDAEPNSRNRRYRPVDPFTAFWFRFVLPNRTELELGREREVWRKRIRPDLDHHLSLVFPRICRQWVERHADEALPAGAREVGALWGRGYDLDVAGTLANGAVAYGVALWGGDGAGEEVAEDIGRQADETRYGFGRQGPHRIVFTDARPGASLRRRAQRDDLVHVVGPEVLVSP